MPKHPRLVRRGATFYHRAAIPVDIRDTYPKTEETFSLRTKDPRIAVQRVRKAAAEVDARFERHRRSLGTGEVRIPVSDLTDDQLELIEKTYYTHLLEEDDETRAVGFYDREEPMREEPRPTFEEYEDETEGFGKSTRYLFARGKSDVFFEDELDEVIGWAGLGVRLTRNSSSFKKAVRALQAATVRAQKDIERRNEGDVIKTPKPDVRDLGSGPLASRVRSDWIAEKSGTTWVEKTKHEHEVWTQHFLDLVGDKAVGSYSKADGREFKRALQKLPANWSKQSELRGLSFSEAISRADEFGLAPMSDKNINKIIGFVGSFWLWAKAHYEEVSGNPFEGLRIKIRTRVRDERDPFTAEQLKRIFNAPLYRGCLSEAQWASEGSQDMRDSGRFWVPLISLFSGARLGEIVQLRTSDVHREQGINFFSLEDEGEDQRLKNENSRRRIPVHPTLIELGFIDFLERRKASKSGRLFPDLKLGNDGYFSSPFSKFFGRFLKSVGAKGKRTSFHSFRHNFEDACRNAEMPREIMDTLQGHGESGMAARYGKGHVLRKLNEWLPKVAYEGLDLSHLHSTGRTT